MFSKSALENSNHGDGNILPKRNVEHMKPVRFLTTKSAYNGEFLIATVVLGDPGNSVLGSC